MQFVWRGTFIDEAVPNSAATRRTRSEPPMGPSCSVSPFGSEREYVTTLEARACHFVPLKESPKKPQRYSHRRTPSVASAVSVASTRCPPSPRSQLSNDETTPARWTSETTSHDDADFMSRQCTPVSSEYTPLVIEASHGESEPRAVRGKATAEWSIGSVGHPGLCNRPCIQFSRGECTAGRDCRFCHLAHPGGRTPHLDKRHRELLLRLSFHERAAVALPIMKRQVAKLGLTGEAQQLLTALESVACKVAWDARTQREGTSLTSALGALSFRSVISAICKAADTPEWLQGAGLEEQLEQIRFAERVRTTRR
jgi:hypothetical protein